MRTAAALIIGNELLTGKIADKNLVVLARTLRSLGIKFRRAVTILDELDIIANEVRSMAAEHDWLFTSGGVGPTHDDLTIAAVAKAFDVNIVVSEQMEQMLRSYYGDRILEGHLLMARIPEGARLVRNASIPWPAVVMRNVWVLPGVPEIFEAKQHLIRSELGPASPFLSLSVLTTLDEGQLKPMLDAVVEAYPDIDIGSYPQWTQPNYRTKLTFDGIVEERVRAARDAFAKTLPEGTLVEAKD